MTSPPCGTLQRFDRRRRTGRRRGTRLKDAGAQCEHEPRSSTHGPVMLAGTHTKGAPDHWIENHGEALYRYAYRRLGDRHTAEDLTQETLLSAWGARHSFAGNSSERTWLVGILKHRLADHWRKARREPPMSDFDAVVDEYDWNGVHPHDPPPDIALEQRQKWQILVDCLAMLPPAQARAVTLCGIEGLSGDEACKLLGMAPPNLWVTLHRARARLRRDLANHRTV